ncbi:aminoglycoside 3'-phosphotransferase/choline kinase domain protein [Metarhizium robertsii]|uniref:Aminoglycoside 3'-phosphotransferase/choline kinase domain protein n=2 Tax=Metarhizium robertsii TaxID=568076 RepID=A0A0A1UQU3_9HYPO|nr:aminoglycoside 3'-phosphotransferase/choline kinase domain protein [Metarhizium robertsii]
MARSSHFNNGIVERLVHYERDQFIRSVRNREAEILQLASTSCDKGPSSFFQAPAVGDYFTQGSYNLCFFIQFSDLQRCVHGPFKVGLLLTTVSCLEENTTIPVPKILAYSEDANSDPLSTFIILDYVDGTMLSSTQMEKLNSQEREQLYTSLADIYIQLRRLEFHSIGRLEQTQTLTGFQVGQKAATIDINMQQLEGLDPFAVQDAHSDDRGCMQSATAYANMLLDIGYNAFFKSRNAVEHAKQWIDPTLDNGPFVLVHGDLHPSNLMVNDKMRIIGVLDWEWSRVVPVQFFVPPLWISGRTTVELAGHNTWQLFLITSFKEFLSVTESRELYMFGNTLLSREWAERSTRAEPLVANALENWTDLDWFAYRYLSRADKEAAKESIKTFIDEDPLRRLVAEMKERDASAYHKEFAKVMDTGIPPKKQPVLLIFLGQLSRVLHAGPNTAIIACVGVPIMLSLIWRRPWSSPSRPVL